MSEKKYTLTLTKEQLKVLNYACDQFSRLICGQDWSYQNLMEEAWEKRSKKATGKSMDKDFEGGWQEMRHDAERLSKEIKKRFWGLESNAMYGIYYNDYADILFDLHRVLRHQLWKDKETKSNWTVDAVTILISLFNIAESNRTFIGKDFKPYVTWTDVSTSAESLLKKAKTLSHEENENNA